MAKILTHDVWGNSKDGFEVNQSFEIAKFPISFDNDDKTIYQILFEKGLTTIPWKKISANTSCDGRICFELKNGKPIIDVVFQDKDDLDVPVFNVRFKNPWNFTCRIMSLFLEGKMDGYTAAEFLSDRFGRSYDWITCVVFSSLENADFMRKCRRVYSHLRR